eukprot:Skav215788  [mRNA]  locus=scaffold3885:21185:22293:+ [translate_table: standard]
MTCCCPCVLITGIKVEESVAKAMNEINAQRRLREAAVEKGESEKFLKIKAAEADAEAKRLAGVGMAAMRAAMAQGISDSMHVIKDSGLADTEAMQMMVTTQYLDTLKDFSHHTSLVVPHRPKAFSHDRGTEVAEIREEEPPKQLELQEM